METGIAAGFLVIIMGFMMFMVNNENKLKIAKSMKIMNPDCISRDYGNVPALGACPRCGSRAHLTTTVYIPLIRTEPEKICFNKFDTRIVYSVHCDNCSLGTGAREEISQVMNDWNVLAVDKK